MYWTSQNNLEAIKQEYNAKILLGWDYVFIFFPEWISENLQPVDMIYVLKHIKSSKSNMHNETYHKDWYIKKQVTESLGISTNASPLCHASTFNCSQINSLSIQASIHASDSTSSGYQCHWEAQRVDKYTAAPTNRLVPLGEPVNQWGKVQVSMPWPHFLVQIAFLTGIPLQKTSQAVCLTKISDVWTLDWRWVLSFDCSFHGSELIVYFLMIITCYHKCI